MARLPLPLRSAAPDRPVPEPPVPLPPGHIVAVPGVGELFVRDSGPGAPGPTVLLLHGWMFASDLNWWRVYGPLREAGYRVLAVDHRGHGRGLRTPKPLRLSDCAADAAALVAHLRAGPVIAVGYSMGGPIAQLLARDHPEAVGGIVLCATAQDWQDLRLKLFWCTMGLVRLWLGLFPVKAWQALLEASRVPRGPERTWTAAELTRGSSVDLAEAGRELSRYDARPWLRDVRIPAAVVVTARDRQVPPRKQRAMADALDAPRFEVGADHLAVGTHPEEFRAALLAALEAVAPAVEPAERVA